MYRSYIIYLLFTRWCQIDKADFPWSWHYNNEQVKIYKCGLKIGTALPSTLFVHSLLYTSMPLYIVYVFFLFSQRAPC